MFIDREIAIKFAPREDGGLRVWSDDVLGLILSGPDQRKVLSDAFNALYALLTYKSEKA